jgi:hypothetical protein
LARRRRGTARAVGAAGLDQAIDRLEEGLLNGDQRAVEAVLPRLLEEGTATAEILTQRLISGRARVPAFVFELLGGLAGPDAADYLGRVAEAREAEDLVRFGARRRMGWPEQGENKERLTFLETLADPDETLLRATAQGADSWPQNGEILQEVLGYLLALPARRRQALAASILEASGDPLPWLFNGLLHAKDKGTQRLVIKAIASGAAPGADAPLARLARTTGDARLKAEAAAAARSVQGGTVESQPLPPVDQALLSMLDGEGGQVALVLRELGEGICMMANVFHNELVGVKGAFGSNWLPKVEAEGMLEDLEDGGIGMIEVPLAAVRGALSGAQAINAARGEGLPPTYEIWEPLLHDSYPPAPDEPVVATTLDDTPYAGRDDLVARGDALYAHPFFQNWGFDLEGTSVAMEIVPPPLDGVLTDQEIDPLVRALATPEMCARFRDRLRRQAWLLDHLGDDASRDLALASAAAFATADPEALVAMPFLRAMVAASVQQVMMGFMFDYELGE